MEKWGSTTSSVSVTYFRQTPGPLDIEFSTLSQMLVFIVISFGIIFLIIVLVTYFRQTPYPPA